LTFGVAPDAADLIADSNLILDQIVESEIGLVMQIFPNVGGEWYRVFPWLKYALDAVQRSRQEVFISGVSMPMVECSIQTLAAGSGCLVGGAPYRRRTELLARHRGCRLLRCPPGLGAVNRAGFEVVEAARMDTRAHRGAGKSDPLDARRIAAAGLNDHVRFRTDFAGAGPAERRGDV
jgi:hypothetical protein